MNYLFESINDFNREDVEGRYIKAIIASMDFMEIREALGECLRKEKSEYSHKRLYNEIKKEFPDILYDILEDCHTQTLLKGAK
jgi:hypothetical protein